MKFVASLVILCGLATSSSLYSLTAQEIALCKRMHSNLDCVGTVLQNLNMPSEQISEMINYDLYGAGSLVHAAAARGDVDLLQYLFYLNEQDLLEINFDQPSRLHQDTPLVVAVFHRNDEVAKFLIKDVRVDFLPQTFRANLPRLCLEFGLSKTCAQILREVQASLGDGFVILSHVFG